MQKHFKNHASVVEKFRKRLIMNLCYFVKNDQLWKPLRK